MVHSSISKPQAISSVLTSGYAGNLTKGQLAIVKDKAKKGLGAEVVADFAGMSKNDRIQIRVGELTTPGNLRIKEVKSASTGFFPLDSVIEISAHVPSQTEVKVDHLEVGYDGINAGTGLFIPEGKSATVDLMLYGEVASMFFGQSEYLITKEVYRPEGATMQEVIQGIVKELKEEKVPTATGWASVTDQLSQFLEIGIIDSSNEALAGTDWTFSTVIIPDAGESNDLAVVQAQYPSYKVEVADRKADKTVYRILHPASVTLSNVSLTEYDTLNKGCEECLAGYSTIVGGVVYHVSLEDDGTDQTGLVDNLPGYVATTAVKLGNNAGVGSYSIVLDDELTQAEINSFIATNNISSTAVISKRGTLQEVCTDSTTVTYAWSAEKTCKASVKQFSITLPDTECGTSRLAELQAYYPDLTIVEAKAGGCKRVYSTSVVTNLVCEECDDIYLQGFEANAPENFEGNAWVDFVGAYDENAEMGIFVKGKPFFLYPEQYEEDFIPYIETSLKVKSLTFGAKGSLLLNFDGNIYDPETEYAQSRRIAYAQDVNNGAEELFGAERMGDLHYTNKDIHKKNLFARANLSQERILKYHKKYVQYAVKFKDNGLSQMGASRSDITHESRFIVEYGRHQALETILNKLAAKVGLETVNIL